jgi:heme A synthase
VLVTLHVVLLTARIFKDHSDHRRLTRPALFLSAMLLLQLLLGTVSYLVKFTATLRVPIDVTVFLTTTHLAVGALMLVTSLIVTLRSYRYPTVTNAAGQEVFTEQCSV